MEDNSIEFESLLENPMHILDIGCGSGLSGNIISEYGHLWWGLDISENMLNVAIEWECDGELILNDIG